jgi:hypothetical protein
MGDDFLVMFSAASQGLGTDGAGWLMEESGRSLVGEAYIKTISSSSILGASTITSQRKAYSYSS